ncbi:MAG: ABC transporter ATP-binding protein [Desulfuromonadia bacterium]
MSSPLLTVTGLRKVYGGIGDGVDVLKGIDLTVEEGEAIALVGASGAGKSTLLHILGTLDTPTAGQVLYDGVDIFSRSEVERSLFRNRTIGFVFQFHHLLPEFSALENVMMPLLIARTHRDEARRRGETLLGAVGLGHRMLHRPGELSGGEQQRVAVARALVMNPRFVMADEPTGNLDQKCSEEIHELMMGLKREFGLTLLVVTHNERLAERMGRVIRLQDGMIV